MALHSGTAQKTRIKAAQYCKQVARDHQGPIEKKDVPDSASKKKKIIRF